MKDPGRQKDRQRWERKEWASLVKKHPRRVKASPWGRRKLLSFDEENLAAVLGTACPESKVDYGG